MQDRQDAPSFSTDALLTCCLFLFPKWQAKPSPERNGPGLQKGSIYPPYFSRVVEVQC